MHSLDFLLQAVENTHPYHHNCKLFLADNVVNQPLHEFNRKRVQIESHKPLEDPCLVRYLSISDFHRSFGQPLLN